MGYRYAAATRTGRSRRKNEDAYALDPSTNLYIVADGMGGHEAGEVASHLAAETIRETVARAGGAPHERALIEAIRKANDTILSEAERREIQRMGTTVVTALCRGQEVLIGHVGDSRAYAIRDHRIRQLTQDHSMLEAFKRHYHMTEEQQERFPFRHVLQRALGTDRDVSVDVGRFRLKAGDVLLLCSDGLSNMVPDERIVEIVRWACDEANDIEAGARKLILEAAERGGTDDATCVLIEWGGRGRYSYARVRRRLDTIPDEKPPQ